MSSSTRPSITLSDVGLTWPDGSTVLAGITGTFGAGRTGLIGLNGSGKSTLLRLIAGELRPSNGRITTSATVTHIPQTLTLKVDATVADLLGVGNQVLALRAIEAGDASAHHFDMLGDHWDVESRAAEALRDAGLPSVELDRRGAQLSGGEALLVAIAGLRPRAAPIVLLDEPTNNLDRAARAGLAELVHGWTGTLVVVSHDPALLDLMDDTAELHDRRLTVFGGPYSVAAASRGRTGCRSPRRAGRRAGGPDGEAATHGSRDQARPACPLRTDRLRQQAAAEDRHAAAQDRGAGVRGETAHRVRRQGRGGPRGPPGRQRAGPGRRADPHRPARPRRARRPAHRGTARHEPLLRHRRTGTRGADRPQRSRQDPAARRTGPSRERPHRPGTCQPADHSHRLPAAAAGRARPRRQRARQRPRLGSRQPAATRPAPPRPIPAARRRRRPRRRHALRR